METKRADCMNCMLYLPNHLVDCERCGFVKLSKANTTAWRIYTFFSSQFCHDFHVGLDKVINDFGIYSPKERLSILKKLITIHAELYPNKEKESKAKNPKSKGMK